MAHPACPHGVFKLKARSIQSKSGKAILLNIHEGFSSYSVTVPMPYALTVFAEGLVTAVETLKQNKEAGGSDLRDNDKAEIQELLRKAVGSFEQYLTISGR